MNKRCEKIRQTLSNRTEPITASQLAELYKVSRQIIVGDIAMLRAAGFDITATPKGYVMNQANAISAYPFVGIIACIHTDAQLKEELYSIVDYGATVIDVTIEHAIYGEISGMLGLSSRYDVDQFITKVEAEANSKPISTLTSGVHTHRIGCKSEAIFEKIKEGLVEKGIALN